MGRYEEREREVERERERERERESAEDSRRDQGRTIASGYLHVMECKISQQRIYYVWGWIKIFKFTSGDFFLFFRFLKIIWLLRFKCLLRFKSLLKFALFLRINLWLHYESKWPIDFYLKLCNLRGCWSRTFYRHQTSNMAARWYVNKVYIL